MDNYFNLYNYDDHETTDKHLENKIISYISPIMCQIMYSRTKMVIISPLNIFRQ